MKVLILALFLTFIAPTGANAYSCEEVRAWARQYGITMLKILAKQHGVTPQQYSEGLKCLRRR